MTRSADFHSEFLTNPKLGRFSIEQPAGNCSCYANYKTLCKYCSRVISKLFKIMLNPLKSQLYQTSALQSNHVDLLIQCSASLQLTSFRVRRTSVHEAPVSAQLWPEFLEKCISRTINQLNRIFHSKKNVIFCHFYLETTIVKTL